MIKAVIKLLCFMILLPILSAHAEDAENIGSVPYYGGGDGYVAPEAQKQVGESNPILFTVSQGLESEFTDLQLEEEKLGPRKKSPQKNRGDAIHKWLGISTLVFVAATVIVHPEGDDVTPEEYETHERFANIATFLAVTTVASGLINYWGSEINLSKGVFYRKNVHAYLGIAGTLLMALAISEAPEAEHIKPGQVGGIMLAASYGLTFTF